MVDTNGQMPSPPLSPAPFDRRAIPNDATESVWATRDEWPIRRIDWAVPASPRGSILFVPGRGDFYEKYLETLDFWARGGFAVTATDVRGQALSGRIIAGNNLGHIDDFATWAADLAELFTIWKATTPAPHIIASHSMGGHIAMRAVGDGLIAPDALVFSAPMFAVKGPPVPDEWAIKYARMMVRVKGADAPAWTISEKPGATMRARQSMLTRNDARYDDERFWRVKRPGLELGPGTWGWVLAAMESIAHIAAPGYVEAITCPTYIFATDGDQLVSTRRARELAARMPDADIFVAAKGVGHEMLREVDAVRNDVLARVGRFLDKVAPVTP
jgi:lysophospholipase